MTNDSAVQFPGDFRVHIALSVSDLEASKRFYELLLGVPPCKLRERYAKFEPTDPSLNLALNESDSVPPKTEANAHFGIQVKSIAAVHSAIERFSAAGIDTVQEEATTCCYAVQDKVWVSDPDGNKWEVFVVLDADVKDDLYAQSGCCTPDVVSLGGDSEKRNCD